MKECYIDFTTIYESYALILLFNVFVLNLSSGVWELCAARMLYGYAGGDFMALLMILFCSS